jgi:hypothetical protein
VLASVPGYVAPSVSLFVSFEVSLVYAPRRIGPLAAVWHRALIAVIWMEGIIDVAVKAFGAMKPRTSAYKDTTSEPLRTVIPSWRTGIWSDVEVTVGTIRCNTQADADLRLCFPRGIRPDSWPGVPAFGGRGVQVVTTARRRARHLLRQSQSHPRPPRQSQPPIPESSHG